MSKKALIVWGGWDGHEPEKVAAVLARELRANGFEVEVSNTVEAFRDKEKLKALSLIVPHWTMGDLNGDLTKNVCEAVESGVGLAGCHGGMCDAFRVNTTWQFMTGGQFVDHPGGGIKYTVTPKGRHWITKGMAPFEVESEQYYMHVDPANKVLAYTEAPLVDGPWMANGKVKMPAAWVRQWGRGRVAYASVGHNEKTVEQPEVRTLIVRGLLWAAHADQA